MRTVHSRSSIARLAFIWITISVHLNSKNRYPTEIVQTATVVFMFLWELRIEQYNKSMENFRPKLPQGGEGNRLNSTIPTLLIPDFK